MHHLTDDALRNRQLGRALARRSFRSRAISDQRRLEAVAAFAEISATDGIAVEQHGEAALRSVHFKYQVKSSPRDILHA